VEITREDGVGGEADADADVVKGESEPVVKTEEEDRLVGIKNEPLDGLPPPLSETGQAAADSTPGIVFKKRKAKNIRQK